VVLTILKNISQWEGLSHILWKIRKCSKPPTRYRIVKHTLIAGIREKTAKICPEIPEIFNSA